MRCIMIPWCLNLFPLLKNVAISIQSLNILQYSVSIAHIPEKEWLAWCAKETINPPSIDVFQALRGWNLEFFHFLPPPDFPIGSSWFVSPPYFCFPLNYTPPWIFASFWYLLPQDFYLLLIFASSSIFTWSICLNDFWPPADIALLTFIISVQITVILPQRVFGLVSEIRKSSCF